MSQFSKTVVAICVAMLAFCTVVLGGMNIGYYLSGKTRNTPAVVTVENNADAYETRYSRLDEVYLRLRDEYYKEVDPQVLIQGAIDGMMASLNDPFSFYYTPDLMTATSEEREGNYVGIGIQVQNQPNGDICVTRVFINAPSFEAGMQIGDIIIAANGCELKAYNSRELSDAISHMKGEEGSISHITVRRGDEIIELDIECQAVVNTRVDYWMLDDEIGYIELYDFFGDAVPAMENALAFMQENHAKSVILDLRGNTGGAIDICIEICNMFLPEGVVVYTEDRNGAREYYYSDGEYYDIPMAVLVNRKSASASEILAAAFQDYGRAPIVGETTYGKGIVQTWYRFPVDGAGIQFTTSAYYTPKGRSIHQTGITPDVYVEPKILTDVSYVESLTVENDSTLKAAYDILKGEANDGN